MGSKSIDVETGTFRDACSRAILELVLAPIHAKYGKKITIQWPVENLGSGDGVIDFTRAYLLLEPRKSHIYLRNADISLDFVNDYLRINILRVDERRYFETREISIANPEIHKEAAAFISSIIDRAFV